MVKIANVCPVAQPCSAAACTLLGSPRLLPASVNTSHAGKFLMFSACANELA